jgi:hypothetical protein
VCWTRPESYWDADCAFKIFGGEHHRSAESAMSAVAADAANEISYLPTHARSVAEHRQRQRQHSAFDGLFATTFSRHRMA